MNQTVNFKVQSINRHRMKTDGKGVTTLVALYGCSLACRYCINADILKKNSWREYSPEQLLETVLQDYCYFLATGGGVTFGGGESLLHAEAIRRFAGLAPQGMHVNIETSLYAESEMLERVLESVDFFIIDIKTMNPSIYQAYTGRTNEKILKNLQKIADSRLQSRCKIRIPQIRNYNNESDVRESVRKVRALGFEEIEVFSYIIKQDSVYKNLSNPQNVV